MLPMGYWSSSAIAKFKKVPEENYKIIKDGVYKQPDLQDVADTKTRLKSPSETSSSLSSRNTNPSSRLKEATGWVKTWISNLKPIRPLSTRDLIVYLKLIKSHSGKRLQG